MEKPSRLNTPLPVDPKVSSTGSMLEPPSSLYQLKCTLDELNSELDKLKEEVKLNHYGLGEKIK